MNSAAHHPDGQPSTDSDGPSSEQGSLHRPITIIGASAFGIALVGFLIGISEPVIPARSPALPNQLNQTQPAPDYTELGKQPAGANAEWQSDFSRLKQELPGLFDPVVRTPEMKQVALLDRLRTRAFDGAPPIIPHPVQQQSYANCLVCHAEGMRLGDRVATKISHAPFTSCTQCHVEASADFPFPIERPETENLFAGRLRAGAGIRAAPGAPPSIPHTTQLRTDCMSCHGLVARPGLRTTHPWLQNCVQCHAPDAELDQQPGMMQLGQQALGSLTEAADSLVVTRSSSP